MRIVFISNYFNHHQLYVSDELYKLTGNNYYFIETSTISDERIKMGWKSDIKRGYLLKLSDNNRKEIYRIIREADVVIWGSAPYTLIRKRIYQNKLTFVYSERLFKNKNPSILIRLLIGIKWKFRYPKRKNVYLLCSSAFSYYDFLSVFLFKNKAFKWGYFPEFIEYEDIKSVITSKENNSILWAARFIDWKHPEYVVELASFLKEQRIEAHIKMIGNGELFDQIKNSVIEKGLSDYLELIGPLSPENVRREMEKSEIFIMTSDRGEGWGAVLNEAMNSGCAVVANSEAGAVPFLINESNGIVYPNGSLDTFCNLVLSLLKDNKKRVNYGEQAYLAIKTTWNACNASKRLFILSNKLLSLSSCDEYQSGPISKCDIIKDGWYDGGK